MSYFEDMEEAQQKPLEVPEGFPVKQRRAIARDIEIYGSSSDKAAHAQRIEAKYGLPVKALMRGLEALRRQQIEALKEAPSDEQ